MKALFIFLSAFLATSLLSSSAFCRPPSRWSDSYSPSSKASEPAEDDGAQGLAPVETPGGTVLAPPPAHASPGAATRSYDPPERKAQKVSDLPPGWESPTVVPPGAITLEELGGRPVAPPAGFPPAPAAAPAAAPSVSDEIVDEGWQEAPKRPPSRWGQ